MDLENKALSWSKRAWQNQQGRQSSIRLPMAFCIAAMATQVPAANVVTRTTKGPMAHRWRLLSTMGQHLRPNIATPSQGGWRRLPFLDELSDTQQQTTCTVGMQLAHGRAEMNT